MNFKDIFWNSLKIIYKDDETVNGTLIKLEERFSNYEGKKESIAQFSEKDTVLITYGDSLIEDGKIPLAVLKDFLKKHVGDAIDIVHILPMFPYTSDDGFSVVDYMKIDPRLGTWDDIKSLAEEYGLMFDAVVNHISKSSEWFNGFLNCEKPYNDYFITADANGDYSKVIRPRALPLLTEFETKEGKKHVWTTFSEDQIDLNFKNPDVLIEVADILIQYAKRGARYIRLDAIGFLWKQAGTTCMHLAETHEVIRFFRTLLDIYAPGTFLITETNVPHKDNISYFGNGHKEAHMVYQFPLPPLVMYSILKGNAEALTNWAKTLTLPGGDTTFFNFLSSHDGIGVRPVDGILTVEEKQFLVDAALKHGGRVSFKDNGDGTKSPYELNINYQDALSHPDESDANRILKFIAAETILLSLQGVPAIYIHSLLGSRNDYYGMTTSEIPRRINREKINVHYLIRQLNENGNRKKIFTEIIKRLNIRKAHPAFSPRADQEVKMLDPRVFYIIRKDLDSRERIHVIINVSSETVAINYEEFQGVDLITGQKVRGQIILKSWDNVWILEK